MIGYMTLGTNDLPRACTFYDALLEPLGVRSMEPNDRIRLYRSKGGQGMLGIAKPFDGTTASVGNGTMVATPCTQKLWRSGEPTKGHQGCAARASTAATFEISMGTSWSFSK